MLIDTHTHLYDSQFEEDRVQAVARAREAGVERLLLPAVEQESHQALFEMVRQWPTVCMPMMGLHPTSVNEDPNFREALRRVEQLLESPPEGVRFVAVGEVGLDLYWSRDYLSEQIEALEMQLEWALRYDLPVVLHTRDAWTELCQVLDAFRGRNLRGVLHSFSGSLEHYHYLKEVGDFCFGVGGPITYKKSALAEILPQMMLEDLVLESDSPYLPPVPYRGKRNESSYLPLVCARVGELCGYSPDHVATITTRRAKQIFRIND